MTSRAAMDRPATVLTAILGVVLIGASLPWLILDGDSGDKTYTITWDQAFHASGQQNVAVTGQTVVTVPVNDAIPSNATIEFTPCNDGATAPLQQPATISWSLFEGANVTAIATGTYQCGDDAIEPVALDQHPDVGQVKAGNETEAEEAAEADGVRSTTYRLQVTVSRPATAGLPLPPPTFTATAKLTIDTWLANANQPSQEVPR